MWRLSARSGDQVRHFECPAAPVRLGSAPDNDFVVPFRGVSRRHLELRPEAGGLVAVDLGSRNGLRLEGKRSARVLLRPGVAVQIGDCELLLEEISTAEGETALTLDGAAVALRLPRDTDTDSLADGPSSPAAALRFVRSHADQELLDARDGMLLRAARRALGAELLALVHLHRDEPIVVSSDGPPLSDDEWAAAAATGRGALANHAGAGAGAILSGRGRRDDVLLAAFAQNRPAAWQRDFFGYLVNALLGEPLRLPKLDVPAPVLAFPPCMVVGSAPALRELLEHIQATLRSDQNVLLIGETGTGKELFARMIHLSGPHAAGPFVAINCAAIPAELLEAELFGVVARVATGVDPRPGLFVQADGGTIFLDEIGDMPERLQAKILRVLQEHEVLPVGGTSARRIDVRVISASNRDLGKLVALGGFRSDLFYRLRGLQFHIPPLRERREDIPQLVAAFASRAAGKYDKHVAGVSRRAVSLLTEHPWPGNVRELESEVERAVLLCPGGGTLQSEHFATVAWSRGDPDPGAADGDAGPDPRPPLPASASTSGRSGRILLRERVDELEREAVLAALRVAGGNKTRAARALGLTRNGLASKMKRLGL